MKFTILTLVTMLTLISTSFAADIFCTGDGVQLTIEDLNGRLSSPGRLIDNNLSTTFELDCTVSKVDHVTVRCHGNNEADFDERATIRIKRDLTGEYHRRLSRPGTQWCTGPCPVGGRSEGDDHFLKCRSR